MALPIPKDELPEKIRRFGDPSAPTPARTMAAKGLVPVKGTDLVTLLVQLSADPDEGVRSAADGTLRGLPDEVLRPAVAAPLHPAILDGLVRYVRGNAPLLEELAANRSTPDATVVKIAKQCDVNVAERIATDQERLLEHPEIIEALYKNRHTRMSTVDRLVELAARNGVELHGVATFAAHVEAIQGQLIIEEAPEEDLPSDLAFAEALDADTDEDIIERDRVDGTEEVVDRHKPLAFRIGNMSISEKIRLALIGDAAARAILVRDANKIVCMAAVTSPAMRDAEAARIAASKQVADDILRYIGNRRDWLGNYELKKNLVFNPKTPMGVSMNFLSHLRANDLKSLARSKNVPAALRTAARNRAIKREK
ncbi:MAG: hypothetical protein KC619_28900 [Myxococcales bacterium]|nr:hypothetical protein [Myxococcales bacterium]